MRIVALTAISTIAATVVGGLAGNVYTPETGLVFGVGVGALALSFLLWLLPKS